MHPRYQLTGLVFGRLTVIAFAGVGADYATTWLCRCECGNEKVVIGKNLTAGRTRSCGCKQGGRSDAVQAGLRRGRFGSAVRSHGMTASPLYTSWVGMKQRCTNSTNRDYRNYGGRGIRVCEEWSNSFEAFYRDMGATWAPGLTIDRIDTNGHYEPGNCHWVPMSEQWKTRRSHGPKRADGSPSAPYPKNRAPRNGAPQRTLFDDVEEG